MSQADQSSGGASLLDYLRLFRLPNLFTAIADVAMGFVFVHASLSPGAVLACLVVASCCLYTAGMVLNDVYDLAEDARARPERPLPAGRIPVRWARRLGWGLLVAGIAAGWLAGWVVPVAGASPWRSGLVVTALAACVVLYDAGIKRTPVGPLVMGSCRLLNVLLGMSVAAPSEHGWHLLGYGQHQWLAAGAMGIYVTGLTWFARREADTSRRGQLLLALLVILAGLGLLGLLYRSLPAEMPRNVPSETAWFLLVVLLGLTIVRRVGFAALDPEPAAVQMAVTHGILSLIVLDAAVAALVSSWYYAFAILALLVPSLLLGRRVYST